jgi:multiple sugar transport system permease protein
VAALQERAAPLSKSLALAHAGPAGARRRWRIPSAWVPTLLTLPTLAMVFLVIGMPLVYSLVLSLHRINPLTQRWIFVGLRNYLEILPDPDFLAAFGRTAYFAVVTVLGGLALGMAMALALHGRFIGRGLLRSVVLIPWAMSPVAVGILWNWIFNGDYGPLNAVLIRLGVLHNPIHWLGDGTVAFHAVALVQIWNQAPLTCLLLLAGLQSMPENLHRAARIDGAGPVARFVHVTLPWLRPMLLLVLILTSINSIMAFDLFWIMTRGGPGSATTVFSWMGYAYAFQFFRFGQGAAILYVLTMVCMVLAAAYLFLLFPRAARRSRASAGGAAVSLARSLLLRTDEHAALTSGALSKIVAPPRRALLSGRARQVAGHTGMLLARLLIFAWSFGPFLWLVIMSLTPFTALLRSPPALVPEHLTFSNYGIVLFPTHMAGTQSTVQAIRVPYGIFNSFVVAACVTAINVALGSVAGYAYGTGTRGRFLTGSLWALMLTRMTPSLALILPFFIVFKTLGLLDTRAALVIAYCSLILPLSTWIMKGYFEGMPPTLERAALVDGCTRWQAIRKVVLPVARPGLVAAAIFCFLVSWNEFIFALILTGTPNAQTIPVTIAGFMVQLRFNDYGPMFAAAVLAVVPPVAVALGFQRYLVSGMLSGSLKG